MNGKEIATRTLGSDAKLTARFEVPYAPGELRAVGLNDGKAIASRTLVTAGPPRRLLLHPDRSTIRADRNDLCYVTVEVTDAVGSGNPKLPESFRAPKRTTFHGRCLAILRPLGAAGLIELRAEGDGLSPATLYVRTR